MAAAFVLFCVVWYIRQTVVPVLPMLGNPADFAHYHEAAREILLGRSPYCSSLYIYPPLFAFLLTPLALLDLGTARFLWFLLSQASLVAAAWVMWRALGRDGLAACVVGFVWAFGTAAFESLYMGQVGPLLTLLLALTYANTKSPFAPALATAIKLLPGVAAIPLLFARQWRALRLMTMSVFLLIVLLWVAVAGLLSGPKQPTSVNFLTGTPAMLTWSVPATALRILDPPHAGQNIPRNWEAGWDLPALQLPASHRRISAIVAVSTFLAGLLVFAVVTRGRIAAEHVPLAAAGFMALILAACPLAWTHYQLMQYPAVALLLCSALRFRRWVLAAGTLACGSLLNPLPVAVLTHYYNQRGGSWSPADPFTLFFWTSAAPAASLALFGLFLYTIRVNAFHNNL